MGLFSFYFWQSIGLREIHRPYYEKKEAYLCDGMTVMV